MHEIVINWNLQEFRKCDVGGVTSSQKTIRYLYCNIRCLQNKKGENKKTDFQAKDESIIYKH